MDAALKKAIKQYDPKHAETHLLRLVHNNRALMGILGKWQQYEGNQYKYAYPETWLRKYARMARITLLDRLQPIKILDIGSGAGWFSWIAKQLGHEPTGIDIPGVYPVYEEIRRALGIPVIDHLIAPYAALPINGKFGLAVAFMASFHTFNSDWNGKAFDFFLKDLEKHMEDRHMILFELNHSAGQYHTKAVYDIFAAHKFRMIDNFCARIQGFSVREEDFAFNELSRCHRLCCDCYAPIWRYAIKEIIPDYAGYYLARLKNDFPEDCDLEAQQALWHALNKEYAPALILLEDALNGSWPCAGHAIALSQIHSLLGNFPKAIESIKRILKIVPENNVARERLALLSLGSEQSAKEASSFWNFAYQTILRSSLFQQMARNSKILAKEADPASWYLKYGAMGLGFNNAFSPCVYWGINNDVFCVGQDPLLHYIVTGINEKRKIF